MAGVLKDLTGQKFGRLTVASRSSNSKHGNARWNCVCECGREKKSALGSELRSGVITRCGCGRAEDLTGKIFGRWTVLSRTNDKFDGKVKWKCRCICGAEKDSVSSRDLKQGKTKSCGCLRDEMKRKGPYRAKFNRLLHSASSRGLRCEITFDDFVCLTLAAKVCEYCGHGLDASEYTQHKGQLGKGCNLDRKDNSKGYSLENVVPCCPDCNFSRGNRFSYEEFLIIGRAIKQVRELRALKN